MSDLSQTYLTTKELAELLRLKERKIYDLAANGEVPCVRVVGKLLFPRDEVAAWLESGRSGPGTQPSPVPSIVVGSHDPLLDWALRESQSGLAAFFDGSHDGLSRFADREAMVCALHIHEGGDWNVGAAKKLLGDRPVVMVEFARRRRGFVVAPGNPKAIDQVGDLIQHRVARRQSSAASQRLLENLLGEAGLDMAQIEGPETPARTEDELVRLVAERKADAAFGLATAAHQLQLEFIPVIEERLDLLVWRREWFEPPFQKFLDFLRGARMSDRARQITGYDLGNAGYIHLNGDAP